MIRSDFNFKEFANNNIHIKLDADLIKEHGGDAPRLEEEFIDILEWNDMYIYGEEFCLSNYEMGINIYNCYSDKIYTLPYSKVRDVLFKGGTLILNARTPDDYDRAEMNDSFGAA